MLLSYPIVNRKCLTIFTDTRIKMKLLLLEISKAETFFFLIPLNKKQDQMHKVFCQAQFNLQLITSA